jgi:hypothetical protein
LHEFRVAEICEEGVKRAEPGDIRNLPIVLSVERLADTLVSCRTSVVV